MQHPAVKTKDRFKLLFALLVFTVLAALFVVTSDSPVGADTKQPVAKIGEKETTKKGGETTAEAEATANKISAQTEFGAFADLGSYMQNIMKFALPLGVGLAVIMTIYGGILFMLSQGQPDRIKDGQEAIQGAILGLIVLILARFLANALYLPSIEEFSLKPNATVPGNTIPGAVPGVTVPGTNPGAKAPGAAAPAANQSRTQK